MHIIKKIKISGIILVLSCIFLALIFSYNKRVNIVVDGKEKVYYTNAIGHEFLADSIAEEQGFDDYIYEVKFNDSLVINNEYVEINSKKTVEVQLEGEQKVVETYSNTTEELVEDLDLEESEGVEYMPTVIASLKSVDTVKIVKLETVIEEVSSVEDMDQVTVEDSSLYKGSTTVLNEGVPSEYNNTYKIVYYDGEEYYRELVDKVLVKEGTPKTVRVGTKEVPTVAANYASGDSVWDSIAACESGGNWAINTGNGYYGGLQFSGATWNTASSAVGISADYAHLASREEQIIAAEWILSRSSWQQQWPSCSKQLGLW